MNKVTALIFVNLCLIACVAVGFGFIRGDLAEKCYNSRIKLDSLALFKKWADKDYYIKWSKRLVVFALSIEALICMIALVGIS